MLSFFLDDYSRCCKFAVETTTEPKRDKSNYEKDVFFSFFLKWNLMNERAEIYTETRQKFWCSDILVTYSSSWLAYPKSKISISSVNGASHSSRLASEVTNSSRVLLQHPRTVSSPTGMYIPLISNSIFFLFLLFFILIQRWWYALSSYLSVFLLVVFRFSFFFFRFIWLV